MDAIELRMRAYAGHNYASPRLVKVEELDFFDCDGMALSQIVEIVNAFAKRVDGLKLECEFERAWGDEYAKARITAYRLETAGETAARIDKYRQEAIAYFACRRAEYERMKREFGDT